MWIEETFQKYNADRMKYLKICYSVLLRMDTGVVLTRINFLSYHLCVSWDI